jgi:hypothetical protein
MSLGGYMQWMRQTTVDNQTTIHQKAALAIA